MNSFQGHFLVAAPHQLDPNFFQTVILVVEHTDRGAFGVIVNRPWEEADHLVAKRHVRRLYPQEARSYFGGPVTGPLMALHAKASLGGTQLLPGVFFSAKEEKVLALMWQAQRPYKVFAGYAGWGPGQLDYEVELGVWRVVPATPEQIFSDSGDLWQQLSRQASRLQLWAMFELKHIPQDPLLN
jgi:putative transcriptional regulator